MSPQRDYYQPTRRLVNQDEVAITEDAQVPRSKFIGTWTRKTAFDAGFLVPILVDEILPGDHMSYNVTAYVRMATPLFPLFDTQRVDTHFFFVPNRLVWTNWVKLMGEQDGPTDSIAFTVPQIVSPVNGYDVNSIYDHMGLPTVGQYDSGMQLTHSALPLRAYARIYNDWFRDQNLIAKITSEVDDGPDAHADYVLKMRAKSHDYFTSALPWPQKFQAVNPLSGTAPVVGIGALSTLSTTGPSAAVRESTGAATNYPFYSAAEGPGAFIVQTTAATDSYPAIFANLGAATGMTINAIRQAFAIQGMLERDARGGTRYVERIRAHFRVTNPDFRLQRPEYIGGGQTPLVITPIAQTAPSDDLPVGALGAAGTAAGQHRASYAATEHGYIIGLISVKSELSYQQGVPKHWNRMTQHDFYIPSLAGLGEQAILRKELYFTGTVANDQAVFGYQERWHEYRTRTSEVTGIMRSTATGTLDNWHLAQRFLSAPSLNATFIQDTPPMARILAAGDEAQHQQYLADIQFQRTAVRPIPTYGTPANLGRF